MSICMPGNNTIFFSMVEKHVLVHFVRKNAIMALMSSTEFILTQNIHKNRNCRYLTLHTKTFSMISVCKEIGHRKCDVLF